MSKECSLIGFASEKFKELIDFISYDGQHTCILVLMTSSGVFPNTLAAPAIAPKVPVNKGLIALLGLSPNGGASLQTIRWQKTGGKKNPLRQKLLSEWVNADLCTSSSVRSSHRSGLPGWSPVSGRWRWDPGTSLSALEEPRHGVLE